MKILKYIVLIIFFAANILAVGAETISLQAVMEIGVVNNPELKASRAASGVSDAQILQAHTRLNPSFMLDNSFFAEKTYKFGIEQTIELGGKRHKRGELSKINKEAVENEILTTLLDVRNNIRTSYIELYKAQEQLNAVQEVLTTTLKLYQTAKKREEAGDVSKLDVLQAEITMINAKNDIQTYKLQAAQAFNVLCSNIGQLLNNNVTLEKPVLYSKFYDKTLNASDEEYIEKLVEIAYKNRPELKGLEKNIEARDVGVNLAKADNIPNISIAAGPDITRGSSDDKTDIGIFIMANVEIPVFNRQQGVIKELIAQKEVYAKQYEAKKTKINQEVRNAYAGIVNNAESIKIYEEEIIPKTKEVLEKSNLSFKEGKSSILTSLNAQEAYISTKFGYIQKLADYANSINALERALGTGEGLL